MRRTKQLQPLSRQHHLGLHVARHARDCIDDRQQITEHWQALSSYMADMREHFNSENNLIVTGLFTHKKTTLKWLVSLKSYKVSSAFCFSSWQISGTRKVKRLARLA